MLVVLLLVLAVAVYLFVQWDGRLSKMKSDYQELIGRNRELQSRHSELTGRFDQLKTKYEDVDQKNARLQERIAKQKELLNAGNVPVQ